MAADSDVANSSDEDELDRADVGGEVQPREAWSRVVVIVLITKVMVISAIVMILMVHMMVVVMSMTAVKVLMPDALMLRYNADETDTTVSIADALICVP